MHVFTTAVRLRDHIEQLKTQDPSLKTGFVPTMGALHEGHMQLISHARTESGLVIASIFVNPTQFNDPKDLERYPRTPEADLQMLQKHGCDIVYTPTVEDVYPNGVNESYHIDLQGIDLTMEGAFRPGHFNGVARVVERFFTLINPDLAFFGRKDFQQVAVIKQLVKIRQLPVQIKTVPTARSIHGLALSSRNTLLTEEQRTDALIIFKTLKNAIDWSASEKNAQKLKARLVDFFNTGKLKLEYLEIVDDISLQPVSEITSQCTCCIAAFCGNVRLIDNVSI